jgi:hypothetical protein
VTRFGEISTFGDFLRNLSKKINFRFLSMDIMTF